MAAASANSSRLLGADFRESFAVVFSLGLALLGGFLLVGFLVFFVFSPSPFFFSHSTSVGCPRCTLSSSLIYLLPLIKKKYVRDRAQQL